MCRTNNPHVHRWIRNTQKFKRKIKDRKSAEKVNTGANIQKKEYTKKVQHDEEAKTLVENIKDGNAKNHNVICVGQNDEEKKRPNEFQSKNNKDNATEGGKIKWKYRIIKS